MQPSFADGFGTALASADLMQPVEGPSTSAAIGEETVFASSAEQPTANFAEAAALFPTHLSLPETPTLGRRVAASPARVFSTSTSPDFFEAPAIAQPTQRREQGGTHDSRPVSESAPPVSPEAPVRSRAQARQRSRPTGESVRRVKGQKQSATGGEAWSRASGTDISNHGPASTHPDSLQPSLDDSVDFADSPQHVVVPDLSDLSMGTVNVQPTSTSQVDGSVDPAQVSMQSNPIHRAHRPPMLSVPSGQPSENGSVAGQSTVYASHAILNEPATIPAVTNDINVVDADQHIQNDKGYSDAPASDQRLSTHGKPLTPPGQRMTPMKWWLTKENSTAIQRADPHDDWWYDPEAIMSRKPSVRFRRSVDIQLPVCNEQVCALHMCVVTDSGAFNVPALCILTEF
jgi:hypothetical protein